MADNDAVSSGQFRSLSTEASPREGLLSNPSGSLRTSSATLSLSTFYGHERTVAAGLAVNRWTCLASDVRSSA
jgi:hypothetical protein